ncbi:MAG: hypothetical protein N2746_06345 [Deltaproteobacteria bacterium]|nr:hypothetical protein [Deltaproteobacteria bacterium]
MNQKDVEISGKVEKYYSLFSDPPLEIKVKGPSKFKIFLRKVVDRKNPLTKLPVTVTIILNTEKIKEIMLNDRDGTAIIKDATMFNAGAENSHELDIPEGEHSLKVTVSKSAIKGVLIRIEKLSEEKQTLAMTDTVDKVKKEEKEFIPPIIPPLEPLVPSPETKKEITEIKKPSDQTKPQETFPKGALPKEETSTKATPQSISPTMTTADKMQTHKKEMVEQKKKSFGEIVILSIEVGAILPLEYGNPGGYGEFSSSLNIYKGFSIGGSIASYNINRDYIVNDPNIGNDILKFHLHGVPISGFIGYKYQLKNIIAKFKLGSGINAVDIDIRRNNTPKRSDTINSFQMNTSAELSYILKYGAVGMGLKYLHTISDNMGEESGFAKNIKSGGVIITIGYNYGF